MKILYSAGDRIGAAYPLRGFVDNCKHEVKVAAYLKSGFLLNTIDWTLDAIPSINDNKFYRDSDAYKILLNDVDYYEPDLIICDNEFLLADIAVSFGIKLWCCSSLYLTNCFVRSHNFYKYFYKNIISQLERLSEHAEKSLVYSPFGDVVDCPKIKDNFEWVRPYHNLVLCEGEDKIAIINNDSRADVLRKILKSVPDVDINTHDSYSDTYMDQLKRSNWEFNIGYTTSISDAIYSGITKMCVAPYFQDVETLINAEICSELNIGDNVGQVELMESFAIQEIEKSIMSISEKKYSLKENKNKFLHELI